MNAPECRSGTTTDNGNKLNDPLCASAVLVGSADSGLQRGPRPELRRLRGWNRDFGTCARIAADTRRLLDHLEAAEACETNVVAPSQSLGDRPEHGVDDAPCFRLRQVGLDGNGRNELTLVHGQTAFPIKSRQRERLYYHGLGEAILTNLRRSHKKGGQDLAIDGFSRCPQVRFPGAAGHRKVPKTQPTHRLIRFRLAPDTEGTFES